MPRKNPADEYPLDPIELERRIREREEFVESLFQPIYWGGPEWKLDWLVQDLIPVGYLVMLAGPPKSGKTCLATALALAVANGLPFAGRPVHQGGVLWVSAEESPRERQLLLGRSSLVEPSTPLYTCYQRLSVTEERTLSGIADWVHRTGARLLVVDPLIACAGHSLADSWAARSSLQELKTFAELHQIAVLVIHHQKRDAQSYRRGRVADNAQLAATASMNIVLSSTPISDSPDNRQSKIENRQSSIDSSDPSGFNTSTLQDFNTSTRNTADLPSSPHASSPHIPRLVSLDCYGRGAFANRTLYLVSRGPLDFRPTQVEETAPLEESPILAGMEQKVLAALQKGPRGSNAIIAETRLNDGSVRNAITNLRKKGQIKMIDIGKNKRIYALRERPKDPALNLNENEQPNEQPREPKRERPAATQKVNREAA